MGLVLTSLEDEIFMKNNVRFQVIGDIKRLPVAVAEKLKETIEHTANNNAMTMVVALSYSARWELTEATKQIAIEVQKGEQKSRRHRREYYKINIFVQTLCPTLIY